MSVTEVEQALLALGQRDRAAVIQRALRSLDTEETNGSPEIDQAWRAELNRRIDDVENGRVALLDVERSHAQLRAALTTRRA